MLQYVLGVRMLCSREEWWDTIIIIIMFVEAQEASTAQYTLLSQSSSSLFTAPARGRDNKAPLYGWQSANRWGWELR
jgi:hypothetical protein